MHAWNYMKTEVPILCDFFFFPLQKWFLQLPDAFMKKTQQIQAWNFVCEFFNPFSFASKKKNPFSPFTLILSVQTHSVHGVGKCHLLRANLYYLVHKLWPKPSCKAQWKRWEDNIREWTGLECAKSQRAVENWENWRKLVVKTSVVPKPPSQLRDRWW